VDGLKDYYDLLGVERDVTPEELRHAYRELALRYHPDRNINSEDTELFLEIGQAYETLIDPEKRADYDTQLTEYEAKLIEEAPFICNIIHGREKLLQLGEPQVHYILMDILPSPNMPSIRAPINLSIVVDRSTSMQGQRLDQVRNATLSILNELTDQDSATIVAFSDHAELIVSTEQAHNMSSARARLSLLQAGGGTEIAQGLKMGLDQLQHNYIHHGVNHLILLTDGRTYGDEDDCIQLADVAASHGIIINGIGIGADWSDRLVDEITSHTGGLVAFLDSPRTIGAFLKKIFDTLGRVYSSRMKLHGNLAQQVDLRSAFRLFPDPMPLSDSLPILLGDLGREGKIQILLEMIIHPIGQIDTLDLAHISISGDILGSQNEIQDLPVRIRLGVTDEPDLNPPPDKLLSTLSFVALYRMQEKARHEAELGQSQQSARRLENLATQLLASGERELAKAALNEAARVTQTRRFSSEGEKVLKYGTRSLLLPAKTEDR
jgi:Ca-activated chloride channel family protein